MNNKQDSRTSANNQEQLHYFSTVESHFVFNGPSFIQIKSAVKGEKNYCHLDQDSWSWKYGGIPTSIHWSKLNLNSCLTEILKAFIFRRLRLLSPHTVSSCDVRWIQFLRRTDFHLTFPWSSMETILIILSQVGDDRDAFFGFKAFYKFGFSQGLPSFRKEFNDAIQEARGEQRSSSQYQKVLLQEINGLSPTDESVLLDYLYAPVAIDNYCEYRNNVLLHLAFELAPRPLQLHSLSAEDVEVVDSANKSDRYFSLWLPMAKKRNTFDIEKR